MSRSTASVAGRYVFYNNSHFDGNDPAANADDNAIATDKTALLPGQHGHLRQLHQLLPRHQRHHGGHRRPARHALTAGDFTFKVGNDNNPGGWPPPPAPTSVTGRGRHRRHDRVTIIWADNAIQKQVAPGHRAGHDGHRLAGRDVFYFGNAIGDTAATRSPAPTSR